jgi:hypothetical protein
MSDTPIWRYLSLAKYIDLLRTKSLFFPKASLFADETEGKWFAHTTLYSQRRQWSNSAENARILEQLLERAGDSPDAILQEAALLYAARGSERTDVVQSILTDLVVVYPHKRREYLQGMIDAWSKHHQKHNQDVSKWAAENNVYRESTYISCWNRAPSTSLAMWEMYGGGREAVVVRSTTGKLAALLTENQAMLDEHGLEGAVVDVQYIANLKTPDESVHNKIYEVVISSPSTHVSQFTIKPSIYEFEQEVRAIVYPKRENIFEPMRDPHPGVNGFSLAVGRTEGRAQSSVSRFVDSVYIHPTLDSGSMMFQVVKEVNSSFGEHEIPIVADRIEALGADIYFKPGSAP